MPANQRSTNPKAVSARTRTAYHEAGHAVLSASIAGNLEHVSIRPDERRLGRSAARMPARPTSRVQIHLAGYVAEHLLTGRRSRPLDREIGFACLARIDPALAEAFEGSVDQDGHRAVQAVVSMGVGDTAEEIRREIDRFYEVTRESLSAIWPAVVRVAKALLEHEELDREAVARAIGDVDIVTPVLAVQLRRLTAAPDTSPQAPR